MLQGRAMFNFRNAVRGTLKPLVLAICISMAAVAATRADSCGTLSHAVPPQRIAALSRGFNADGWFNGAHATPPATPLLLELRKSGMTHVRLPVPAERLMRRFASSSERDEVLRELGRAIKELTSLGYSVSVDLHPGDRFNRLHRDDATASMAAIKGAWGDLAQVMRNFSPDLVFAELLNEPDLKAERWQRE